MSRAAIRYAKAILDIAQTSGNATSVNSDMLLIASTIGANTELKGFLVNPIIKIGVKKAALSEVFPNVQSETKSLFQLLFENKRFEILENVANQYKSLFDESNGVQIAKVTTATALTPELEAVLLTKIAAFSDKKITIENTIDPSIIGGFILRIGDQQFNASVSNKISELKKEFSN